MPATENITVPVASGTEEDSVMTQIESAIQAVSTRANHRDINAQIAMRQLLAARDTLAVEITGLEWHSTDKLFGHSPRMRPEIIAGLFRLGEVVLVASESKLGKTWLVTDMARTVCTGGDWLGHEVKHSGPVLYLNLELDRTACEVRLDIMCREAGEYPQHLHFAHLRGMPTSIPLLMPKLVKAAKEKRAVLIIIDALYNVLGDRDENSNGDMSALMAEFTMLSIETGCAICIVHHFNKDSHKKDDGSAGATKMCGAGALHRSPEGIITITRVNGQMRKSLGLDDRVILRVEGSLRTLPELKPFLVEKETGAGLPIFRRLDIEPRGPTKRGAMAKVSVDQLVAWIGDRVMTPKDIKDGFSKHGGCKVRTVEGLLSSALKKGALAKSAKTGKYAPGK